MSLVSWSLADRVRMLTSKEKPQMFTESEETVRQGEYQDIKGDEQHRRGWHAHVEGSRIYWFTKIS